MHVKIYASLTAAIYGHALKNPCLAALFFVLSFVRLAALFHLGDSSRIRASSNGDKLLSEEIAWKGYVEKFTEVPLLFAGVTCAEQVLWISNQPSWNFTFDRNFSTSMYILKDRSKDYLKNPVYV